MVFFNNKCNTFFGLNLTLVYTFPNCMAWRFHFPIRNYDFKRAIEEDFVTKACIVGNIQFKTLMKWAGDMVRMTDERFQKRSETKKQEGCRKRRRPQIRWENCIHVGPLDFAYKFSAIVFGVLTK